MSKKRWIVLGAVGIVGGGLWLAGDRPWNALKGRAAEKSAAPAAGSPAAAPAEVAVTVAPITPRTLRREVRIVGTLHGFDEIEIGAKVDGRIGRILRDVGDIVRPGDVLLEIDDVDYRLAVEEMQRGLELELSRLGLKASPDGAFDVRTLPSVARAMIVETNAAKTLDRYKQLVATNAITKDDFEKAELNFEVARLDVKQRIIEAEEALASARHRAAALDTARQKLRDAQVTVPPLTSLAGEPQPQVGLVSAGVPAASVPPDAFPGAAGGRSDVALVPAGAPPTGVAPNAVGLGTGGQRDGETEGQRDLSPYGALPTQTLPSQTPLSQTPPSPAPPVAAMPAPGTATPYPATPIPSSTAAPYTTAAVPTLSPSVSPSLSPSVTPSLRLALPGTSGLERTSAVVPANGPGSVDGPAFRPELAVAERMVSEGEMVRTAQGAKLFRLVVENPLKLQAAVPERYAGQMKPGRPVELTVEAYPGRTFVGTVARVNPTVDVANRTFQVEVAVPNDDHALKPGTFAVASVVTGEEIAATVPEEAIVRFAGVTKLFVVSGGKVQSVPVELGLRADDRTAAGGDRWVEIRGAAAPLIAAGSLVATSGQSQLADQTSVRVREQTAPKGVDAAAAAAGGKPRR